MARGVPSGFMVKLVLIKLNVINKLHPVLFICGSEITWFEGEEPIIFLHGFFTFIRCKNKKYIYYYATMVMFGEDQYNYNYVYVIISIK